MKVLLYFNCILKKDIFFFLIYIFTVFWPVESKPDVHFRQPKPENLDNP